jgi:hypothetical protein
VNAKIESDLRGSKTNRAAKAALCEALRHENENGRDHPLEMITAD